MLFVYLETIKENIEFGFEKLKASIASQVAAFLLQDSSFILSNNCDENDSSVSCGNLFKFIEDSDIAEIIKKNLKSSKRKVSYFKSCSGFIIIKIKNYCT